MKFKTSNFLTSAGAAAALSFALATQGTPITFSIDGSQSSLTFSGVAFGLVFNQQTAGSLVDSLTGTLVADLSGGVLTFSGGSTINVQQNPNGPFSTNPNPIGNENGNFGVRADGFVTGAGAANIRGVYKGLVLDITSGTAQDGQAPAGQNISPTQGVLDYGILLNGSPYQANTSPIIGKGGLNTSAGTATFDGTTLTLPVTFSSGLYSNRREDYTGTIVGTVVPVPEPSTLALAGLGAASLVGWGFRRSRSRR